MIRRALLSALIAAVAVLPASAQRFADVEVKATHVAGAVHMLEGAGGNIGVSVGEDGILIVDDQFAELADKIRKALGELGQGTPRYVLNTHYHGDHTGGNPIFGVDATIIAHHNVRKRLASGGDPMAPRGLPVVTYGDSVSVHFNGEEVRLLHLPAGHTDGDTVVLFSASNVVHMGDLMFSGRFPYVDLDAGGTVEGYRANIARVLEMIEGRDGVKLIPGHGPLSTPADLRALHDMIVATRAIVTERIAQGQNLEQIQSAGLPEEWSSWSWGFIDTDRWLGTLHAELSGS